MKKEPILFTYGKRGEGKLLLKDVPCPNCDFIGDDIVELGEHFEKEHGVIHLWSALPFENEFKNLICPTCKKPLSQCNHKTKFLKKPKHSSPSVEEKL